MRAALVERPNTKQKLENLVRTVKTTNKINYQY